MVAQIIYSLPGNEDVAAVKYYFTARYQGFGLSAEDGEAVGEAWEKIVKEETKKKSKREEEATEDDSELL